MKHMKLMKMWTDNVYTPATGLVHPPFSPFFMCCVACGCLGLLGSWCQKSPAFP